MKKGIIPLWNSGNLASNGNEKFTVIWSKEDRAYIGLYDEYPSLSFISTNRDAALAGIKDLVIDITQKKPATEDEAGKGHTLMREV